MDDYPELSGPFFEKIKLAANAYLDALEDLSPRPTPASMFATVGVGIQVLIALSMTRYPEFAKKGDDFISTMLGTLAGEFGVRLGHTMIDGETNGSH